MNNIYFSTPNIIEESSRGFDEIRIADKMFEKRQILCNGEIDRDFANSIAIQLQYLEMVSPDDEVTMFINSPGGEVQSGLIIYDVMQGISCPIRTVCMGMAASMGSLLFTAGDTRDILPHACVMIHDPLISGGLSGSALQVQARSDSLMRTRQVTAEILSKHTGKSIDEIFEKTKTDTYFYGQEAVDFGLCDKVITKI